jgi:hypothetical protein
MKKLLVSLLAILFITTIIVPTAYAWSHTYNFTFDFQNNLFPSATHTLDSGSAVQFVCTASTKTSNYLSTSEVEHYRVGLSKTNWVLSAWTGWYAADGGTYNKWIPASSISGGSYRRGLQCQEAAPEFRIVGYGVENQ